jgi:gas vesicle protein
MKMASDLLSLILDFLADSNKRARRAGTVASKKVTRIGRDVSERADDFRKSVQRRMNPEPSVGKQIAIFAAGFGIGLGIAMLVAPYSGEELRSKIADGASDSIEQFRRRREEEEAI